MIQYFTTEGLEKLKKELHCLKTVKIKEIAELLRHAASFGDLKENAAYDDAKEKQAFLQGKILELEDTIGNAEIMEKRHTDKIQVGSTVLVFLSGEKEKFQIVSPSQVDSLKNKISYESPLGKKLLNKKVGNKVKIELGKEKIICEIIEIE